MTLHLGNPSSIRYPRPLTCAMCRDSWIYAPPDSERFTFVLWLRGMVCHACMEAQRAHKSVGRGVEGIQLPLFEVIP